MCIALLTTSHPSYALIVLDNRDAVHARPTQPATFWNAPQSHILAGRDMQASEQGTWFGITREGRLAVLTNFHEPAVEEVGKKSRGMVTREWLEGREEVRGFAKRISGEKAMSGFSLVVGEARKDVELMVVSNREPGMVRRIAGERDGIYGLSNSLYGEEWPKVKLGRSLVAEALRQSTDGEDEAELVKRLFRVLETDTCGDMTGATKEQIGEALQNTILVPTVDLSGSEGAVDGAPGQPYGTTQQTVMLVGHDGKVTFVEKTLHGTDTSLSGTTKRYTFQIQGWSD
ncbi:MAG: hypothetical protein M1814_006189 [Vezdaea aestivalis]|nr:MAG: hypothetical protein M1814_006189 [Vezdaea aestivalis]